MAGNYPDAPARRLAWDRDGSILAAYNSGFTSFAGQGSVAQTQSANDEDISDLGGIFNGFTSSAIGVAVIFPGLITLRALYIAWGGTGSQTVNNAAYSSDSTNGIDGTWTSLGATFRGTATPPGMRSPGTGGILPVTNVKAIRTSASVGSVATLRFHAIHVYGDYQHTGRLAIWHPTLDQEHAGPYFDWGDVPRGTVHDRTFRVKNLHSLTANGVVVTREALTLASPSQVTQHTLSDGGAFAASINIGNLAPGAISGVLTVRNSVDPAAQLSLAWLRLIAAASSFT